MGVFEKPDAVWLLLGANELDGFGEARVRWMGGSSEVVEGTQDVIAPARGEGELEPGGVDDGTGGLAAEQGAIQQVLFGALAGCLQLGGTASGTLVREQPFEHVDGGVEGGADGAVFGLTVPAAVGELFGEQAGDDGAGIDAEVGAERDSAAVDARLDFAIEEGLVGVLPAAVGLNTGDGVADGRRLRIDAKLPEELEGGEGGGPGLAVAFGAPMLAMGGEAGAAGPLAIVTLESEELGAPAFGSNAGTLRGEGFGRGGGEVAEDLPADGGIGVEEPVKNGHGGEFSVFDANCGCFSA